MNIFHYQIWIILFLFRFFYYLVIFHYLIILWNLILSRSFISNIGNRSRDRIAKWREINFHLNPFLIMLNSERGLNTLFQVDMSISEGLRLQDSKQILRSHIPFALIEYIQIIIHFLQKPIKVSLPLLRTVYSHCFFKLLRAEDWAACHLEFTPFYRFFTLLLAYVI